ncbi:MAG: hypothetical protein KAT46_03490 [Deltaproteobacteria bacterium]|nr:hypothetical protein [Deltaproteobacteria bacterium]
MNIIIKKIKFTTFFALMALLLTPFLLSCSVVIPSGVDSFATQLNAPFGSSSDFKLKVNLIDNNEDAIENIPVIINLKPFSGSKGREGTLYRTSDNAGSLGFSLPAGYVAVIYINVQKNLSLFDEAVTFDPHFVSDLAYVTGSDISLTRGGRFVVVELAGSTNRYIARGEGLTYDLRRSAMGIDYETLMGFIKVGDESLFISSAEEYLEKYFDIAGSRSLEVKGLLAKGSALFKDLAEKEKVRLAKLKEKATKILPKKVVEKKINTKKINLVQEGGAGQVSDGGRSPISKEDKSPLYLKNDEEIIKHKKNLAELKSSKRKSPVPPKRTSNACISVLSLKSTKTAMAYKGRCVDLSAVFVKPANGGGIFIARGISVFIETNNRTPFTGKAEVVGLKRVTTSSVAGENFQGAGESRLFPHLKTLAGG